MIQALFYVQIKFWATSAGSVTSICQIVIVDQVNVL